MRRKKIISCAFLTLLLMAGLIAGIVYQTGAHSEEAAAGSKPESTSKVTKNIGNLEICVDPRIELLTALQQQADYPVLSRLNSTYKDEMKEYFKKYSNHKAIKAFNQLSDKGFNYDAPPAAMLYLSNPPNLSIKHKFDKELVSRASSQKQLNAFIDNLRTFGKDTNFQKFYQQHAPFYTTMVNQVYKDIKDMNLMATLDDYYGMKANSYHLILSPMLHSGGYGPSLETKKGLEIYGIIGPDQILEEKAGTYLPAYSVESIVSIIWHEFGHSFVNPTTRKYLKEINQYDKLFSPIESRMNAQAYNNWETCVNEHIIRAVTARMTYLTSGKEAGDQVIAYERANSFFYVPALCESLEYYESHRDTYPTFESYYPELIKVFKKLSEQKLPDDFYIIDFIGPINAAFQYEDTLNVVIITPTQEADPTIQSKIHDYVESIRNQFFSSAKLLTDSEALTQELGDCVIIAYGTMDGNLWLKHYKDTFPFRIENDRIMVDKSYEGTDLEFISALPNPQNRKRPLLVYTAQKAEDLLKINTVFHGPTDYILAKDEEELCSGFYYKKDGVWSFTE